MDDVRCILRCTSIDFPPLPFTFDFQNLLAPASLQALILLDHHHQQSALSIIMSSIDTNPFSQKMACSTRGAARLMLSCPTTCHIIYPMVPAMRFAQLGLLPTREDVMMFECNSHSPSWFDDVRCILRCTSIDFLPPPLTFGFRNLLATSYLLWALTEGHLLSTLLVYIR